MRITNGMMTNNTLFNVNINKMNLDTLNTREATQKKIQKASEDPIVAIRALRFRSQLAELSQYLDRNVPDAESWMRNTEDALRAMSSMMSSMQPYMVQGANDTLTETDRKTIVDNLVQYRAQIFQDANADYAGRRLFSGYKTDTDMTFVYADKTVRYDITQKFDLDSFDIVTRISDTLSVDVAISVADLTDPANTVTFPTSSEVYRIRLAYDKLDKDAGISAGEFENLTYGDPPEDVMVRMVYKKDGGYYYDDGGTEIPVADPYKPGEGEIYVLVDTGEMIFDSSSYGAAKAAMSKDPKGFQIEYTKIGFEKGELRPEHYFDCTRITSDGITTVTKFIEEQQDINYTVNFNQSLKVNSEGKNAFTHDIARDIDEIIEAVEAVSLIVKKQESLKSMMADAAYADPQAQAKLKEMEEALKKEYDLAEDKMQKIFERNIGTFQKHQAYVDGEVADLGARIKRLELNKERLSNQQLNLEELKSTNEDADLAETIIRLSAAEMVYEASLSAASKVITKSLLDYL